MRKAQTISTLPAFDSWSWPGRYGRVVGRAPAPMISTITPGIPKESKHKQAGFADPTLSQALQSPAPSCQISALSPSRGAAGAQRQPCEPTGRIPGPSMCIVAGSEVGALWPGPPGAVELGLLGASCSPTSQVHNHEWKLGVQWRTGHTACLSHQ